MTVERADNWGRWGAEDERGALNLITPEVILRAAQACRTGKVYSLALPIKKDGVPLVPYRGAPQRLTLVNYADDQMYAAFGAEEVGANEDVLVMASHNETHMDALCHVFYRKEMYNGFSATTMRTYTGAERLGIDKVGCIVGRAVLLDMARSLGDEVMSSHHVITSAELESCAQAQGVTVGPGDILLIRTGWLERYLADPESTAAGQPGIGMDAVNFIRDRDVVAVGADNSAVEATPFDGPFLTVHIEMLVKLGVYLFEHLVLSELAQDRAYESLLVVAPLPVVGGTGSPVNPVAIT